MNKTALASAVLRFLRCRRGNMAVMTALILIPLMAMAGFAVDLARVYTFKQKMATALDAAGLAAGRLASSSTEADLEAYAQKVFDANIAGADGTVTGFNLTLNTSANTVAVSASGSVKMALMQVMGFDTMAVSQAAEVTRENRGIEVALVLDNTGSMWTKPSGASVDNITAVKNATNNIINILFGSYTVHPLLKVTIIPYVATVNVSNFASKVVSPMTNTLDTAADSKNWKGCIMERAEPHDTSDETPAVGGYWTQYRWATATDNVWTNTSIKDNYGNANNGVHGPNIGCPTPIIPLTNVKATLTAAANATTAWNRGGTQGNIGLAWGWRMLSPSFTALLPTANQAASYNNADWQKALVIMTDGENTIFDLTSAASPNNSDSSTHSDYTAYGRIDAGKMGSSTTNTATALAYSNAKMAALCTTLKNNGVTIYTVLFSTLTDTTLLNLWKNCASSVDKYYYAPNQTTLSKAFTTIGSQLTNLRISK